MYCMCFMYYNLPYAQSIVCTVDCMSVCVMCVCVCVCVRMTLYLYCMCCLYVCTVHSMYKVLHIISMYLCTCMYSMYLYTYSMYVCMCSMYVCMYSMYVCMYSMYVYMYSMYTVHLYMGVSCTCHYCVLHTYVLIATEVLSAHSVLYVCVYLTLGGMWLCKHIIARVHFYVIVPFALSFSE